MREYGIVEKIDGKWHGVPDNTYCVQVSMKTHIVVATNGLKRRDQVYDEYPKKCLPTVEGSRTIAEQPQQAKQFMSRESNV